MRTVVENAVKRTILLPEDSPFVKEAKAAVDAYMRNVEQMTTDQRPTTGPPHLHSWEAIATVAARAAKEILSDTNARTDLRSAAEPIERLVEAHKQQLAQHQQQAKRMRWLATAVRICVVKRAFLAEGMQYWKV